MDPQLIPYGWGLFSEKEEVILVEQEEEEDAKEKEVLMSSHMVNPPNMGSSRMVIPPNNLIRIVTERPEEKDPSLLQPPEVRRLDKFK